MSRSSNESTFVLVLWDIGHKLFRSTPQSYPVPFLEGDILNPEFLAISSPVTTAVQESPAPAPDLASLKSLNPLHGRVSGIFTGAFFHLFSYDQQYQIARALAGLLSPEPGSILLGVQGGVAEKGFWQPIGSEYKMACHSPESWAEMWHEIFKGEEGEETVVEVKARLREEVGGADFFGTYPENTKPYYVMEWSVTRK